MSAAMMMGMFTSSTPLTGVAETYDKAGTPASPSARWALSRALAHWKALLVVARHVYRAEYPEAHSTVASEVLLQWVRGGLRCRG